VSTAETSTPRFASREEFIAAGWAFVYFFSILCSFYILRPVREEMGIRTGVENFKWLYLGTFLLTILAVPTFGKVAARWPRRQMLPAVYLFFAVNLLAFYALMRSGTITQSVAAAFFVWLSVYNIFVVSVFWSFMADIFAPEQAKRLYGPIAAGGSAGAMAGPLLTASTVKVVGIANLFLVSSALLGVAIFCIFMLSRWAQQHGKALSAHNEKALGGSAFAGVGQTFSSRYLIAIAAFVLLLSILNTLMYFEQARLIRDAIADSAARTQLFAKMDLAVNIVALVTQMFIVRFLLSRLGVALVLALLFFLNVIGFVLLAATPMLMILVAFQVFRRSTDYAVIRPAREVLFTVVSRAEKYKAKNFIDLFVFRGGDAASSWFMDWLIKIGLSTPQVAAVGVPFAALGVGLGWYLGRQQEELQARTAQLRAGAEGVVVA
jgi:AAA family ATP:ADP antiporter